MDKHRIGIVIPALNEAATIVSVIAKAEKFGMPIVVDDGSSDQTSQVAGQAGAEIVRHEKNLGYDKALNSGFERAADLGCEYIITIDADGQHDPTILNKFIHALDSGAEVVVGIRDRRQRLAETMFAWLSRLLWGIQDPLCGMKAYRVGVFKALGHFDSYDSIGTELVLYAAKSGEPVAQIPIMTRDREDAPRFGRRLSANMRIVKAMWRGILQRV